MLSHAGPVTFWCVKVISVSFRLTPRSVSKCRRFTLAPTNTRPRPRVGARSPDTPPGDPDVGTGGPGRGAVLERAHQPPGHPAGAVGTPPTRERLDPPLVALTGRLPTF